MHDLRWAVADGPFRGLNLVFDVSTWIGNVAAELTPMDIKWSAIGPRSVTSIGASLGSADQSRGEGRTGSITEAGSVGHNVRCLRSDEHRGA